MPSYLVTGAAGQLGKCFQFVAAEFEQHRLFFSTHLEVDINKTETLSKYYAQNPFDGIINCAAYTNVDNAETEQDQAYQTNARGVQNLVDFAENMNLKLIHFSTDFVFDGTKEAPYLEDDTTNPINVYGESKLAGEEILTKSNCQNVCVRVSWLFSPFGKNFVRTIINLIQYKAELLVVDDQFGKPTYGIDLARNILANISHPHSFDFPIYHFAQGHKTSWFEFAKKIIGQHESLCELKPTKTLKNSKIALRPPCTILDTQRIEKILSLSIRNWEPALSECIKLIKTNEII